MLSKTRRIGARLFGWWSGASGINFSRSAEDLLGDAHRLRVTDAAVGHTVAQPATRRSPRCSRRKVRRYSIAPPCPAWSPQTQDFSPKTSPWTFFARKCGEVKSPSI